MMQFRHVQDAFASDDCGELKGDSSTLAKKVHAFQKKAVGYP